MTPPDNIEAIAASLTAAQRRAVLTNDRFFAEHWKGHWSCGSSPATARKLFFLGLIDTNYNLARPTPLGLAVRAHLLTQSKDQRHG